jgi:chromosome segregation ATPase
MFKPLIQRLDDMHHGNGGGGFGSVFPAGFGLPEISAPVPEAQVAFTGQRPTKEPNSILGEALGRLIHLRPENDKLKTRLKLIISEVTQVLQKADALAEEITQEGWSILERKHEAILKTGRDLNAQIPKLTKQFAEAQREWSTSNEQKEQRRQDLLTYTERKRNLSQWSTKQEIQDADDAVENARGAYRQAIETEQQDLREMARAESELESCRANLAEASKVELAISAEMSGLPFFDPQTGLSSQVVSQS